MELHLNDNQMQDRAGVDRDGSHWMPHQGPLQALVPDSRMKLILAFLDKDPACTDTNQAVNDDFAELKTQGYTRACLISVPPILGVLVGGLVVAWRLPLTPAAEARATVAMRTAALKFATW